MAVAVFNYKEWLELFPELSQVNEAMANLLFRTAERLLNNTDSSLVQDVQARLDMLNYIVAHLASIRGYPTKAGRTATPSGLVGRVSNATEGTVSVGATLDMKNASNSAAFWTQTQYGLIYWSMIAPYRHFAYSAPADRYQGPMYNMQRFFY